MKFLLIGFLLCAAAFAETTISISRVPLKRLAWLNLPTHPCDCEWINVTVKGGGPDTDTYVITLKTTTVNKSITVRRYSDSSTVSFEVPDSSVSITSIKVEELKTISVQELQPTE